MRQYIVRRLLFVPPTLLAVYTITFAIMHATPGGPWERGRPLQPQALANLTRATISMILSGSSTSPISATPFAATSDPRTRTDPATYRISSAIFCLSRFSLALWLPSWDFRPACRWA